jgi:orotidine-5'-phosphate decarboxylase
VHSQADSPHSDIRPESARERLIVALDLRTPAENGDLVKRLGSKASFYKLGWGPLLRPGGPELLARLLDEGKQVFLDLKFFDVPNTVHGAVSSVAGMNGVRFITVHGNRAVVEAARAARGDSPLKILAVTVLTSLSEREARRLYSIPEDVSLEEHVVRVARNLVDSGFDGVIASPWEVAAIRRSVPEQVLIATPGIRLDGEPLDDQQRTGTPYDSVVAGADYLVVGRSVYRSSDPVGQVDRHVEEIERGLAGRRTPTSP